MDLKPVCGTPRARVTCSGNFASGTAQMCRGMPAAVAIVVTSTPLWSWAGHAADGRTLLTDTAVVVPARCLAPDSSPA